MEEVEVLLHVIEIVELKEAAGKNDEKNIDEEIGDLLFTLVNYCRFKGGASAEQLLQQATDKFIDRFNSVEDMIKNSKKEFSDYSANELDLLWNKAKKNGAKNSGSEK